MLKYLFYFSLVFMLSACSEQQILKTDSMELLSSICKGADSQTLVIFDMDNVLTDQERAFQSDLYDQIKNIVSDYKKVFKNLSPADQEKIKCEQWLIPVQLVDDCMPKLIKTIQSRGVKTLMLTSNPCGKLGSLESIEELCISRLEHFGIDFSKSWNISELRLRDEENKSLGIFYKGGIFTLTAKPLALKSFLKQIPNCKFTKIIFIDDKKENLEKMLNFSKIQNLNYIGIEYSKVFTKKTSGDRYQCDKTKS